MKARRFRKSGVRYSDIERDAILVPFCRAQETRAIVNKSSPRNYIHLIITELVNSGNFISSRMHGNKEIGQKWEILGWPDSPIGKSPRWRLSRDSYYSFAVTSLTQAMKLPVELPVRSAMVCFWFQTVVKRTSFTSFLCFRPR